MNKPSPSPQISPPRAWPAAPPQDWQGELSQVWQKLSTGFGTENLQFPQLSSRTQARGSEQCPQSLSNPSRLVNSTPKSRDGAAKTHPSASRSCCKPLKISQNPQLLAVYGYRDYDPATGRWTTRDLIAEQGGLNLYGMLTNNAISEIDVIGMAPSYSATLEVTGYIYADNAPKFSDDASNSERKRFFYQNKKVGFIYSDVDPKRKGFKFYYR